LIERKGTVGAVVVSAGVKLKRINTVARVVVANCVTGKCIVSLPGVGRAACIVAQGVRFAVL
jgi:hypothetical protein